MNPRVIIIAILISIKIIGVASRVKADNYMSGYTCDDTVIYRTNCPQSLKASWHHWSK